MIEITPSELRTLLAGDDPPVVLDVRETWETAICAIEGSLRIPMHLLPQRLAEIPTSRTVAVLCHHGMRSAMAAGFLLENGIEAVNVGGGIDLWAREVDLRMARY
jgi:rhodanese-related sulfurtransferase